MRRGRAPLEGPQSCCTRLGLPRRLGARSVSRPREAEQYAAGGSAPLRREISGTEIGPEFTCDGRAAGCSRCTSEARRCCPGPGPLAREQPPATGQATSSACSSPPAAGSWGGSGELEKAGPCWVGWHSISPRAPSGVPCRWGTAGDRLPGSSEASW